MTTAWNPAARKASRSTSRAYAVNARAGILSYPGLPDRALVTLGIERRERQELPSGVDQHGKHVVLARLVERIDDARRCNATCDGCKHPSTPFGQSAS